MKTISSFLMILFISAFSCAGYALEHLAPPTHKIKLEENLKTQLSQMVLNQIRNYDALQLKKNNLKGWNERINPLHLFDRSNIKSIQYNIFVGDNLVDYMLCSQAEPQHNQFLRCYPSVEINRTIVQKNGETHELYTEYSAHLTYWILDKKIQIHSLEPIE